MNNDQLVVNKSLISQAEELAIEHDLFNDQYIVTGRRKLYQLLSKIMELAEQFQASPDKEDLFFNLRYKLKESNIKVQENTSDVALLVKYITRADRKTAHVYSRAIETAMACHYKAAELPDLISSKGGLEKLKLGVEENPAAALKQQLEDERLLLTREFLQSRSYVPFARFPAPKEFDGIYSDNCEFEYLVCTQVNGSYNVVCKLPAETELENFVLKKLATNLCKDIDQVRPKIKALRARADELRDKLRAGEATLDDLGLGPLVPGKVWDENVDIFLNRVTEGSKLSPEQEAHFNTLFETVEEVLDTEDGQIEHTLDGSGTTDIADVVDVTEFTDNTEDINTHALGAHCNKDERVLENT
ncbi:hypothetical protein [Polynucleobacter sp.]|uniref:hypothetical protein n=1 Tax=Polynucleobacter sp. TaxID=2029855 RepID=UPI002732DDC1|nr:hypothetical protein [Polynucleobacter sp.]MDP3121305.1 hypothetical protein [Polynucleobacter sp.]